MKDHLDSDLLPSSENLVEAQVCSKGDVILPMKWKVRGSRSHLRRRNNRAGK